jgi:AraC-like DNA-binding protein
MKTVILAGLIQSCFLTLLIFSKKDKSERSYLLAAWLLVMMLVQFYFLFSLYPSFSIHSRIVLLLSAFPLASGPLYLSFVAKLTEENLRNKWMHFLPFMILLSVLFSYEWFLGANFQISEGFIQSANYPILSHLYGYLMVISPIVYILWSYRFYMKFRRKVKDNFSTIERYDLTWLKIWILTAFIFFVTSFPAVYLATRYQLYPRSFGFKTVAGFNTVYVFIIGFFGLRQTSYFHDFKLAAGSLKYEKSGLDAKRMEKLESQLSQLMKDKKLFLNADLKSSELAKEIGVSVNHLSELLNQHIGKTFYQYINDLRVEEVKDRLVDKHYKHLSNIGIATDCGFRSRSTFSKTFKKNTGLSPSEYRKMHEPIG